VPQKIIIIGAGPAGLSAAYKLVQGGADVIVLEAGRHVGGLARSFELWGQIVDCGPHRFFSNDKIVNDFFKEVVRDDFVQVNRLTRIYYNNRFFYYPLKVSNVLANIGLPGIVKILGSYALTRLNPVKDPRTFEEWVINKFGYKLYSIFFKNYSEKLWGIPCSNIDADWAAQRIKKFSLFEAVRTAVFGNQNNKHKTLVDQFAYPRKGTGSMYTKMKDFIQQQGAQVLLNTPVKRVLIQDNKAIGVELMSGEKLYADEIISTMPLTLMVRGLDAVPEAVIEACNKLYYRNTILVYIEVDALDLFPDNWIYVHSPEVLHGRITNFRNWSPGLYGDKKSTILCLEYWCFDDDAIWKQDETYFKALAAEEVKKIKLVKPDTAILNAAVVKLQRCYPVYETGYMKHVEVIKTYLDGISNLRVIGRYGSFKYNNQDHSILMGLLAAREILSGSKEDLWSINTDSEYQEKGEALTNN
jgi:protoporphyrinogen oxidase